MKFNIPSLENISNNHVDCLVIGLPWVETGMPLMAPATLKPIIESAGLSCRAIDLNVDILKSNFDTSEFFKFSANEEYTDFKTIELLDDLFNYIVNIILSWTPTIVCLSLFSYLSQVSAKWIAYTLRKLSSDIKIIIGGPGCLDTFVGRSDFTDLMLESKIVDYHIRGDGEVSLYKLLTGDNTFSGINDISWTELTHDELNNISKPDYSNYDFSKYTVPALPIIGSRGCVRKCQYCDYIENWKKFTWRTADDVFNEMISQYNTYNIRNFKFQDSLTNGNMNEFMKLMKLMSDHNATYPNRSFTWSGYYIFRNVNKNTDAEWELIKTSGANVLIVGIENFNEDIRFMIGKKFSNEAIDYHLEKALQLGIQLNLLNIVGYVNETPTHIEFIKDWLRTHTRYSSIIRLIWGGGLGIFPETYLDRHKDDLGIVMYANEPFRWVSNKIKNTPAIRAKWILSLVELSKQLGYDVAEYDDVHLLIEVLLNEPFIDL